MMRIATWNVNSLRVRLRTSRSGSQKARWTRSACRNSSCPTSSFRAEIEALGLHAVHYGQKTYNGVAILARKAPADVTMGIPGDDDPQRRVIAATIAGVRLINVYVPNGQAVGSGKYAYKLAWLERLRAWLERRARAPSAARGRRRFQHRAGGPRRARSREMGGLGARQRAGAPGARRDHRNSGSWTCSAASSSRRAPFPGGITAWAHSAAITACASTWCWPREALAAHPARACSVDRSPRAWERPSDHAPVVASFDIG